MTNQASVADFQKPLILCLEETFSKVRGIYLDKGTTLFETIDSMTAAEASEKISPNSASIAAQIDHLRFYLDVLDDYMKTQEDPKVNWREIWDTVGTVDEAQWTKIKTELRSSHEKVMATIRSDETWNGTYDLGGALAILTHTAYHLGGIRVTLGAIRGRVKSAAQ
jgi:hypothetical protein